MNSSHESTLTRLRASVLILVWLIAPWMGAMSVAAHASVTATVVAWGQNDVSQTDVPAGLSGVRAVAAGYRFSVALRSSYHFGGFVAPVNAAPIVNTLKAGAGVPVKFSLGGNKGLAIFAQGYPASSKIWCNPDASTDEIEWTVNADHSRLRYDAATDRNIYVWKTDPAWAGQCRRLVLRLADGIEHSALFRFIR